MGSHFALVGLHMKSALAGESFTLSRNCPVLGWEDTLGSTRSQISNIKIQKHQKYKTSKIQNHQKYKAQKGTINTVFKYLEHTNPTESHSPAKKPFISSENSGHFLLESPRMISYEAVTL